MIYINKITPDLSLIQALNSIKAENRLNLLDLLLDLGLSKGNIIHSKKYYADHLKCSTKTIERDLKIFSDSGIISKRQFVDKNTGKIDKWSVNIISINPRVYTLARYFKYKFKSLMKYLFFTYIKPSPKKSVAPYKEEKDVNYNNIHSQVQLRVNIGQRSNRMSTVGDQLAQIFNKITQKPKIDDGEWQDIGNGLVRNRRGIVKCVEDVS